MTSPACITYRILYDKDMTREPLPRFRADLRLVVDIAAKDEQEAEQRLNLALDFIMGRCDRTTFKRLAGMPSVDYADIASDVVPS